MFLLFYDYVDDVLTLREPHRPRHLELLRGLHERGVLKMAGALADPVDGAVLVFSTDDRAEVERFVAEDPYVANGLVTSWRIRAWTVVVGG